MPLDEMLNVSPVFPAMMAKALSVVPSGSEADTEVIFSPAFLEPSFMVTSVDLIAGGSFVFAIATVILKVSLISSPSPLLKINVHC